MAQDKLAECFNQYLPALSWFLTVLLMGAIKNNWLGRIHETIF